MANVTSTKANLAVDRLLSKAGLAHELISKNEVVVFTADKPSFALCEAIKGHGIKLYTRPPQALSETPLQASKESVVTEVII